LKPHLESKYFIVVAQINVDVITIEKQESITVTKGKSVVVTALIKRKGD